LIHKSEQKHYYRIGQRERKALQVNVQPNVIIKKEDCQMKKVVYFLLLLIASSASADFDSTLWKRERDSAWNAICDYPIAFQWDSNYMVRWTSWSCAGIHKREDDSRATWNNYFNTRADEDNAAFPEYLSYDSVKFRKAQDEAGDRYSDYIMANLDKPNSWVYLQDSLVRIRWDAKHTCEWIVKHRHKLDSILHAVREEKFIESMNARYNYDTTPYGDFYPDDNPTSVEEVEDVKYWYDGAK
jgi:hypothetical protein